MDGLFGDGLFGAEELVEAAFLDFFEEGGGDVHVRVEGCLSRGQLRECCDGCLQVGIVFVVGGAGYVEYGNLEEWAQRTGKRVTYGGTEILDPGGFVEVLQRLGKEGS